MKTDRHKIIEAIKNRINATISTEDLLEDKIADKQLALLLGELQVAQFELETQNDELSVSAQLLEKQRERFEGFFNLAPVGYFILNRMGAIQEVNRVALSMLQVEKLKIFGQRFQSFVEPSCWEKFHSFLQMLRVHYVRNSTEIQLLDVDKEELFTRIEGIAMEDAKGQLEYYIAVIDITETKRAQLSLEETTQRLELTLKESGTGTWSMNLTDNQLFLDANSMDLLGINHWEFSGKLVDFFELIVPEDKDAIKDYLHHNKKQKSLEFEFRREISSGEMTNIAVQGNLVEMNYRNPYFVGIMVDVTHKKEMLRIAEQLENEKKQLILSATFTAQESERERISSALHDSICQLLYGIRLKIQGIQIEHQLKNEFKEVYDLLAEAIKETRELSYELTPSVLRDFGFREGIKEIANRLTSPKFKVSIEIPDFANQFPTELQLALFRVIQELLNNCVQHSSATKAKISISVDGEVISLRVTDNGKGFKQNPEHAMATGSGLSAIKNRAFLLNGELNVAGNGKETSIEMRFKYK